MLEDLTVIILVCVKKTPLFGAAEVRIILVLLLHRSLLLRYEDRCLLTF